MYDTIKDYFENLNPICFLSEQSKGIVLKNSDLVELKKGKYLFKRGETDNKSYFLLEGVVELQSPKNTFQVHPGTDTANYALAQFQPRQYSAQAKQNSVFLTIEKELLDSLAEKDGIYDLARPSGMVVSEEDTSEDVDWMSIILQSDLFSKLPPSDIQKIFSRIEPIEVKKGEMIVRQDDPGDFFYIIELGRAEVIRKASRTSQPVRLGRLSVGEYFGEEALISECPRNATVMMLTDGDLMRLPKDDFIELIRDPILRSYQLEELEELHNQGAVWIDVRFPADYLNFEKIDIPLHAIRRQIENLDFDKKYIVCCEDGNKSAIASFLLSLQGFDAAFLEGGLINCKNQVEENGFDLSFLNDKDKKSGDEANVIDFIPRRESKVQQSKSDSELTQSSTIAPESPKTKSRPGDSLQRQKKQIEKQIEQQLAQEKKKSQTASKKRLAAEAEAKKAEDEKLLAQELERQKKEVENQLAEEVVKQKKEIEKQLAREAAEQKREIEQQLIEEAKKEKQDLEKQLAQERAKLKADAEKRLAEEAAKQKRQIEKQLAEEAQQEKKEIERQLAEERARQKADVEKQLAEEAAKQKKEIERQLAEELKKEKQEVERQLAEERARQKALVEKQLAEEAAKQKKEIEEQLREEARREKKEIEKQLAEEKARQKAAAEKRLAEEKAKQKKLIELQLIEERARQKAAVEKQLEEERAKQKAAVERQMAEEAAKKKRAIEEQMAREAARQKLEVEKQLADEAERRKKAIEEQLAAQELRQKAVIDDIINTGKPQKHDHEPEPVDEEDDANTTDSIAKLINHYRLEKEKAMEEIQDDNEQRLDNQLSRIKNLNNTREQGSKNLKNLKQKISSSLYEKSKSAQSKESNKKVVADKHKVLSKRFNILNDPRFREHINRLNVEKEKEVIDEINSFKNQLDMDDTDSHVQIKPSSPEQMSTQTMTMDTDLDSKSEKTIQMDIESWIEDQEKLEHSPKRQQLIEVKKKLMNKLQKQSLEERKIDRIRNHTLMTEIQSALDKKKDK